jgi:hypothetical protein
MTDTNSLVITTLQAIITGKVQLSFAMRSSKGMRFRSLANFVCIVVGFLNVLVIRLRSLLLAAALSFEIEMV